MNPFISRIKRRHFKRFTLMLILIPLASCATAPNQPKNLCAIFKEKPHWYGEALKAEKRWGTPTAVSMSILYQESRFVHNARPKRTRILWVIPWKRPSSAYGYAQAVNGTWAQYQKSTGNHGHDRNDFGDAINFVGWYTDQTHRRNGIAKHDTYSQYLNYHEGWAGFRRKTYNKKPWLKKVASRVTVMSTQYQAQYQQCKNQLSVSFWQKIFGL